MEQTAAQTVVYITDTGGNCPFKKACRTLSRFPEVVMSAVIVNVGRIDSHTIIVEFSDESFVTFTVAELASAKRFREMPDPEISPDLMN